MKRLSYSLIAGLLLLVASLPVRATLIIEISDGYENALPIAVVPFRVTTSETVPENISLIIQQNLRRSGRFAPITETKMPARPALPDEIIYEQWRGLDIDHIVLGQVTPRPNGLYDVEVRLVDVLRQQPILAKRWTQVKRQQLRQVAHQISDEIYLELTGIPGAFNTRLAYVTMREQGKERLYTLEVSDSDGHNAQPILRSKMPIMSPNWSPDGRMLAYVTFETGRSNVVLQSLDGSYREIIADFVGINSAPAWSPDGKQLALTLSKDGSADIYVMDVATRQLRKITRHWAIETEAAWAPDGEHIYFNSDRRGQPQIFKMNIASGEVTRISFEGNYNANPKVSPNGRYVSMVHANNGFNIGLLDLYSNQFNVITNTFLSESQSFAPNSDMLVYAMNRHGKGQLAVVSVDGRSSQILRAHDGQVREPAWGPYLTLPADK